MSLANLLKFSHSTLNIHLCIALHTPTPMKPLLQYLDLTLTLP